MNGWDFAKYFVDVAYNHWVITMAFLCILRKFALIHVSKEVEDECRDRDGDGETIQGSGRN